MKLTDEQKSTIRDKVKALWENEEYRSSQIKALNSPDRKKLSIEQRKAISDRMLGEKHPRFGKPMSQELKDKLSKAKIGKYAGVKHPGAKVYENISLLSPEGVLYTRIECLSVFCQEHGLQNTSLCAVLKGRNKSHLGWRLVNEEAAKIL